MKKDALNNALRLGQLITLLTPLANASKVFSKKLAQLRSGVHEQVVVAAYWKGETAAGRRAELRIAEALEALQASVMTFIDIKELLKRSESERSIYAFHVAKKAGSVTPRVRDLEHNLLEGALAVKLESASGTGFTQEFRAEVIRAYTSAVRNSSWLSTLMRLELGLAAANAANAVLTKEHGSHQGREMLNERLLKLCPTYTADAPAKGRGKKVVVSAEGLYSACVLFNADTLLAQSQIAELVDITLPQSGEPAGASLTGLLEKLTKPLPVPEGTSVADYAQARIDELVSGLQARRKAIEAERAKDRLKLEETAKAAAIEALQHLNPRLLKVLKDNPDLLKAV